ncbi:MAG: MraY family glycosyltransferase [Planctomycetota bacterium]|nr:MraY family glycosyltransferase [Planctomycetota bacterium]
MTSIVLGLGVLAFLLSFLLTRLLIPVGHRLGTLDSAGVAGQTKEPPRRVPNTGGIAIFWSVALPIALGLGLVMGIDASPDADWRNDFTFLPADLHEHVAGLQSQAPLAGLMLGSALLLHILGLRDDRKALGPWLKLVVMALPAFGIPLLTTLAPGLSPTRLFTFADAFAAGPWLSILLTGLWIIVVTNALNFMDNMDGLSAGTALVASACFLASTLLNHHHEQWFVAAVLALLVGACGGFLVFNAPRPGGARIFMGDGGSLVLGFLLAFLTIRTTYVADPAGGHAAGNPGAWYAVFMPLCVLAVPIYDLVSVSLIRLSRGRSPMVGDLNHLSHRLVRRGLSRRAAVGIIWGLTLITGLSGIILARSGPEAAALVGVQVVLLLIVIGLFEYRAAPATQPEPPRAPEPRP